MMIFDMKAAEFARKETTNGAFMKATGSSLGWPRLTRPVILAQDGVDVLV